MDDEFPKPYPRNVTGPLNIKARLVRCDYCNYEIVTDVPAPCCGKCGQTLITVLVTGNVQLVE